MTLDPQSPLARALAELEGTMQAAPATAVDPDRRRAANRLAELIRSADGDLPRFAKRHLPGRDVSAHTLVDARAFAAGLERLVSLLGRSSDADAVASRLAMELGALLPELEANATPIAPPKLLLPSAAVPAMELPEAAPAMPAPRMPAPRFAELPIAMMPLPVFFPEAASAISSSPQYVPSAPPWILPPSSGDADRTTHDEEPRSQPERPIPRALPFRMAELKLREELPLYALESDSVAVAHPFTGSGLQPRSKTAPEDPTILPFRAPSSVSRVLLPEHLGNLDLATYATLRVLLELFPARSAELFEHYRIPNGDTRDLLDAKWNLRITHDPVVRAEWQEVYSRTLAHYQNRP
ncbi:MAG: hypothetical protein EXR75_16395 [Myxococcales bacterium]|nr:hypothetical protein [Myxococcales bacterium]